MNRQFKRRVQREWKKIKWDTPCTKFVERNGLFSIPYVLYFKAIKVSDDFMCVYHVGMFEFREGSGFHSHVTVCQFVNSLFRSVGSVGLGYFSEADLEIDEEMEE